MSKRSKESEAEVELDDGKTVEQAEVLTDRGNEIKAQADLLELNPRLPPWVKQQASLTLPPQQEVFDRLPINARVREELHRVLCLPLAQQEQAVRELEAKRFLSNHVAQGV
jgi:hypothetical protein